ncbi:DNA-directed DNA polymerase [Tanacetum coccineum]
MEEMLYKFIDEGKREHEEMRAFICDFQTTNKLLFKERNNSLIELRYGVQELLKVMNNVQMINYEVKGVTTRGGKTTTQDVHDNNTDVQLEEPPVIDPDKLVGSNEVLIETQSQKTNEPFVQPSNIRHPRHAEELKIPINFLRRPFLATARAMIDMFNKKITLRVGDDEVIFDVDQSIKRPTTEDDECYRIDDLDDTINEEAQELLVNKEPDSFLSRALEKSIDQSDLDNSETTKHDEFKNEHLYSSSANEINEKKPELKNLPQNLDYAYLYGDKSFPIIISSKLSKKEKMSLLQVLEKRKGAITWKMSDIKGISPSYCTHKILMEDDYKLVIQPQRRLNPKVQNVVKNEIVKLLDSGLIYPISDSSWVSPIHVMPKKGGMTIVLNDNNELIPSCTVTGWRVCIDYHKLNDATRKDHFPLPFIDQMLERLCGNEYYCFLDGFSGFFKILIAPEDQEKITFTCPYGTFAYRRMPFGLCNAPATFQRCMTKIFHDMVEDFMEVFMDDFSVFGFDIKIKDKKGAENLAADHLSRLENPNLGTFTEEEIADMFPEEHLMILKTELNKDEPWYADYVNYDRT